MKRNPPPLRGRSYQANMKIPVSSPWLTERELEYVEDAVKSGNISGSGGQYIERFERAYASFCNVRHAVSCVNGTAALQLAVRAAGIEKGDEVIIPAFTNIATALGVVYAGAKPVLVDARADTWCLDESKIAKKITRRTKAIIPVHIYGHPVEMDAVMETAEKYHLKVIEDAAEAQGALFRGRVAGAIGDMGCFSLYANKIVTTGEGGMVVTGDAETAEKLKSLRNLAYGNSKRYLHTDLGYNYRLSNVLAAIGLAQMERVDALIAKKIEIASLYNEYLRGKEELTLPVQERWAKNVYWMYGVLVNEQSKVHKDALMKKLAGTGIETRSFFCPLHKQEAFLKLGLFRGERLGVSEDISERGLYLPSGLALSRQQVREVSRRVTEFVRGY